MSNSKGWKSTQVVADLPADTQAGRIAEGFSDAVSFLEEASANYMEHQPLEVFGELPTSSMFGTEFIYQEAIPVDSSNPRLRKYSPFVISILPPVELYDAEATQHERLTGIEPSLGRDAYTWKDSEDGKSLVYPKTIDLDNKTYAARADYVISNGTLRGTAQISIASTIDIADQLVQINTIRNLPPLVMLINPSSFQISYQKVQGNQRTRYGYVFQEWGEGQPTISLSGRIGSFMSGHTSQRFKKMKSPKARSMEKGLEDAKDRFEGWLKGQDNKYIAGVADALGSKQGNAQDVPSGNREASRKYSASWHNFLSLMQIYKHNGYIRSTVSSSEHVNMVCPIAIDYDGWRYIGHFNSLNYSFSDDKNRGGIEYDMEFTVSRMYDTSKEHTFVGPMNHGNVPHKGRTPQSPKMRKNPSWGVKSVGDTDQEEAMEKIKQDWKNATKGEETKGFVSTIEKKFK